MRLNGWRGDHRCQTVTGPGSETLEQESDGKVKLEVATFFSFFFAFGASGNHTNAN